MIKRTAPPTLLAFLMMAILLPFAIALGAFTVIHLFADAADQFDYLVRGGAGIPGAEYLALRVPFIITQLLPVSLLGGVMFGFGMLNLTNEVVALQALGVSRLQLATRGAILISAGAEQPRLSMFDNYPLARIGIAMAACYTALAIVILSSSERSRSRVLVLSIAVAVLTYLFLHGRSALVRSGDTGKVLICFGVVFVILALLMPAFHTTDLYSYTNLGWLQVRYGLNPYVHPTGDVPDPLHDRMITPVWLFNPCPYGFLFARVSRWIVLAGRGHLGLTVSLFKVMNSVFCAFVAYLIVATRKQIGLPVDKSVLYLFLWNPLIVLQLIANGHNDVLMAFSIMLAIYAASRDHWSVVIPLLVMGALVKYSTAVIIPLAIVEMINRRRFDAILLGGALTIALFLWSGAPYLPDYRHFRAAAIAANLFSTTNSFESVLYYPLEIIIKPIPALRGILPAVNKGLIVLIAVSGAAVLLRQLLRFHRRWSGSLRDFIANVVFAQFLLTCILNIKFYPWYIGGFLPVALLLENDHWLRNLIILISIAELFAFTPLGQAHVINFLVMMAAPILWIAYQQWPAIERDLIGKLESAQGMRSAL